MAYYRDARTHLKKDNIKEKEIKDFSERTSTAIQHVIHRNKLRKAKFLENKKNKDRKGGEFAPILEIRFSRKESLNVQRELRNNEGKQVF